jgi:putative membrane protein
MALNARGWQVLLPRHRRFPFFLWLVWVREAIDGLLPVARLGGSVASARLMIGAGTRTDRAVASLVVDTTVSLVTQFLFTLLGVALLAVRTPEHAVASRIALWSLAGVPLIAAFLAVQHFGLFDLGARVLRRVVRGRFPLEGGAKLDRAVRRLYRRRPALLRSALWQVLGWTSGAGEIWLALLFMGQRVSMGDALVLHALSLAVGSAFFLVPGALGVQEAGFLGVGRLLGLPPGVALAIALARRVRDVIVLGPGLIAWQISEMRARRTHGSGGTGLTGTAPVT